MVLPVEELVENHVLLSSLDETLIQHVRRLIWGYTGTPESMNHVVISILLIFK